ncbi:hypothetical protein Q9966_016003 [Columba livia]|nr:hypothetical protein Q9966_016003 [Columba livia]
MRVTDANRTQLFFSSRTTKGQGDVNFLYVSQSSWSGIKSIGKLHCLKIVLFDRIQLQASKLKVNLMIYLNTDNPGTDPSPERDMPAMIISLVAVKQRDVILSTVKQQQMEQTLSQDFVKFLNHQTNGEGKEEKEIVQDDPQEQRAVLRGVLEDEALLAMVEDIATICENHLLIEQEIFTLWTSTVHFEKFPYYFDNQSSHSVDRRLTFLKALPAKNIRKLSLYLTLDSRTGPLATVSRNALSRNESVSTRDDMRVHMSCQAISTDLQELRDTFHVFTAEDQTEWLFRTPVKEKKSRKVRDEMALSVGRATIIFNALSSVGQLQQPKIMHPIVVRPIVESLQPWKIREEKRREEKRREEKRREEKRREEKRREEKRREEKRREEKRREEKRREEKRREEKRREEKRREEKKRRREEKRREEKRREEKRKEKKRKEKKRKEKKRKEKKRKEKKRKEKKRKERKEKKRKEKKRKEKKRKEKKRKEKKRKEKKRKEKKKEKKKLMKKKNVDLPDLTICLSKFSSLKLEKVVLLHFASLVSPAGPWDEMTPGTTGASSSKHGMGEFLSAAVRLSWLSVEAPEVHGLVETSWQFRSGSREDLVLLLSDWLTKEDEVLRKVFLRLSSSVSTEMGELAFLSSTRLVRVLVGPEKVSLQPALKQTVQKCFHCVTKNLNVVGFFNIQHISRYRISELIIRAGILNLIIPTNSLEHGGI